MAIPDYQTFMTPLLRRIEDGETYRISDLYDDLADEFGLSAEERAELLPSGRQRVYHSRIGWAKTYLVKAGLILQPKRGWVRISERGKQVAQSGDKVNKGYLTRFEDFRDFIDGSNGDSPNQSREHQPNAAEDSIASPDEGEATPQEAFELLYRKLHNALAVELLEAVQETSPAFFERLVVELLVAMGYGGSVKDAGEAIGKSGDNGIDGIIKQDRLGIDNIYIQAKRWNGTVGSPEIRTFAGSLAFHKAVRGVFLTTGTFTANAVDTARQLGNIVLVDGNRLADLMIEFGIGVSPVARYELKRVDTDYFEGE